MVINSSSSSKAAAAAAAVAEVVVSSSSKTAAFSFPVALASHDVGECFSFLFSLSVSMESRWVSTRGVHGVLGGYILY